MDHSSKENVIEEQTLQKRAISNKLNVKINRRIT
jgi:hypothetical protein